MRLPAALKLAVSDLWKSSGLRSWAAGLVIAAPTALLLWLWWPSDGLAAVRGIVAGAVGLIAFAIFAFLWSLLTRIKTEKRLERGERTSVFVLASILPLVVFLIALAGTRNQDAVDLGPTENYRPVGPDVSLEVSRRLSIFAAKHAGIEIAVAADIGTNRERVAKDLGEILRKSGLKLRDGSPTFGISLPDASGNDLQHSIQLLYSHDPIDDFRVAEELAQALNPYVRCHFVIRWAGGLGHNRMSLDITGDPLFLSDGSFVFRD